MFGSPQRIGFAAGSCRRPPLGRERRGDAAAAEPLHPIAGYVERATLARYHRRAATPDAPAPRLLRNPYRRPQPAPAFAIFLADGGNADRRERAAAIRERSAQPVLVPFGGIGQEEFPFPRELVGLSGRPIGLAGFVPVNDLDAIEDLAWYDRRSNQFSKWLEAARARRLWA